MELRDGLSVLYPKIVDIGNSLLYYKFCILDSVFYFLDAFGYMPIIKSAKKALRQNIRRRQKNLKRKAELKAVIKQYKKLVAAGEKNKAAEFLSQFYKKLDKAAKVELIKKNKAARLKSRLSRLIAK